jgi:hypothetical protein
MRGAPLAIWECAFRVRSVCGMAVYLKLPFGCSQVVAVSYRVLREHKLEYDLYIEALRLRRYILGEICRESMNVIAGYVPGFGDQNDAPCK